MACKKKKNSFFAFARQHVCHPRPDLSEAIEALACRYITRDAIKDNAYEIKALFDELNAVAHAKRISRCVTPPPSDLPLPFQEELLELSAMLERVAAPVGWAVPLADEDATVESLLENTPSNFDAAALAVVFRGERWVDAHAMLEKWREPDGDLATWENFFFAFDARARCEWSELDERGEHFGGAWKAPLQTEENRHASELCRERNARALFALNYPKHAVLWTAVARRFFFRPESVSLPYSKVACEWMKRKLDQCAAMRCARVTT